MLVIGKRARARLALDAARAPTASGILCSLQMELERGLIALRGLAGRQADPMVAASIACLETASALVEVAADDRLADDQKFEEILGSVRAMSGCVRFAIMSRSVPAVERGRSRT